MKYINYILILVVLMASCSRQVSLTKIPEKKPNAVASVMMNNFKSSQVTAPMAKRSNYMVMPEDYYEDAYLQLQQMLIGEQVKSFKKAVFVTENAWYENKLSYQRYNAYIKSLASVAMAWKKANPLINYKWDADSNRVALNGAVYHVISDTIKDNKSNIISVPYHYDFNDCFAKEQWENMFVTKLMITHGGNCHSLPFLYKMVAVEVGTDANLCFLPGHIYLNQYSRKTSFYNTELTGKCFPVDAWLMTSGYVSVQSIRTGLYMDTLGIDQSIAVCINDLAKGYQRKFGVKDTCFISDDEANYILKCCNLGLKYYPNYGELLLLKAETLKKLYQKQIALRGLNDIEANDTYKGMEQTYATLAKLDYREIPDALYDRWTNAMINGGKAENENIHDTVVTTNVYGAFGKKMDMVAVSNGTYVELFENDTLRRIGSVMFNNMTHKIEYFISKGDEKYQEQLNRPTVASRFMRPDPKEAHFPNMSPYAFANNSPIAMLDNGGDSTIFYTEGGTYLGMVNDYLPNAVVFVPDANMIAFKALQQSYFGGGDPRDINTAAAILRKQGAIYLIDPLKLFYENYGHDFDFEHGAFFRQLGNYVVIDPNTIYNGLSESHIINNEPDGAVGWFHAHQWEGEHYVSTGKKVIPYGASDPDRTSTRMHEENQINVVITNNHIYFYGTGLIPGNTPTIDTHKFGPKIYNGPNDPPSKPSGDNSKKDEVHNGGPRF